jgi:hypothetical protein
MGFLIFEDETEGPGVFNKSERLTKEGRAEIPTGETGGGKK